MQPAVHTANAQTIEDTQILLRRQLRLRKHEGMRPFTVQMAFQDINAQLLQVSQIW